MKRLLSNLVLLIVIALLFAQCANRGTPSGGEKDITPPVIVKSEPENFSTNFTAKEINIYFDEYIKIKDLQKQLIAAYLPGIGIKKDEFNTIKLATNPYSINERVTFQKLIKKIDKIESIDKTSSNKIYLNYINKKKN